MLADIILFYAADTIKQSHCNAIKYWVQLCTNFDVLHNTVIS